MGPSNPTHNNLGKLNFLLGQQLTTYCEQDPPLTHFHSIPVSILQALDAAYQCGTNCQQAIIEVYWIYLFFLLRPGEYCRGSVDMSHHCFLLRDLQFFIGQ